MPLPVNIDSTYPDDVGDPSVALHQQYHDALHAQYNDWEGKTPAQYERNVIQLAAADAFTSTHQEGGATVMRGTFTPLATEVEIDLDISAYSTGWGGAFFQFNMGVLPGSPPAVWEGGTRPSRIVLANNASRTPLTGVTEFQYFPLGQLTGSDVQDSIQRRLNISGLTVGRTYQWDIRMSGVSYFKEHDFPAGFSPTWVQAIPGDETYLLVAGSGTTRKVAMLSLGWTVLHDYVDFDKVMQRHFELSVSSNIFGLAVQKVEGGTSRYAAVQLAAGIALIDTWTPTVVGEYAVGHNIQSIKSNRAGTYFYVGCQSGHVHRFNISTLSFDQTINLPASDFVVVGGTNTGDTHLWVGSFNLATNYRIDLSGPTVGSSLYSAAFVDMEAHANGRVSGLELTAADLITLTTAGAVVSNADISGGGATGGHLSIAPGEQRIMFSRGNRVGWVWIDSGQIINKASFGYADTTFGEVNNTEHEGTSLALPTTNKVIHWPGGEVVCNPDVDDQATFGASHAIAAFRGADATYG